MEKTGKNPKKLSKLDVPRIVGETFIARLEHHHRLNSTQDRADELASQPSGDLPVLIVSDSQTAGRGRGSNRWWTGRGSLAWSLLLDPALLFPAWDMRQEIRRDSPKPLTHLSLVVAGAVIDTVAPLLADHRVGLHWPNDVVVDDRKLAGVLINVLADGRLILGVGLNTNNTLDEAPPELKSRVATLRDLTGKEHDHTEILISLLNHVETRLEQFAIKGI